MVKALDYFQEKGWIELESKQMTEVYSLLVSDFDARALSQELHAYFTAHERGEIVRIHAMLALFASDTCLSHRLAQYFGDGRPRSSAGIVRYVQGRSLTCRSLPRWRRLWIKTLKHCAVLLSTGIRSTRAVIPRQNV